MCGIYGIVNVNPNVVVDISILRNMSNLLKHRGPDNTGFFFQENVGLGSNRLNIIDLKHGNQPIYNEDKSLCLVYNGEIYNFKELREYLKKRGHVFSTSTDSEIIIHAYEEWAEECVQRFRGMFAFALWDRYKKKLFIARDRIGIKPLYYLNADNFFAFSSETKAFLALNNQDFTLRLDDEIVDLFLRYSWIPDDEKSLFSGIKKLAPAHSLILENHDLTLKRYWKLEKKEELANISIDKAKEMLDAQLQESVRMELVSDVPLGILLSGGIDSSAIAALSQKASSDQIMTFTIGFKHQLDERKYAKKVAQHIGANYHEIEIDIMTILQRFEEMSWFLDDLTSGDPGFFSTYLISEKIKELGVKVVLVGEGSDEILGGYPRFSVGLFPFNILPFYLNVMCYYYMLTTQTPKFEDHKYIQPLYKEMKSIYKNRNDMFNCITNYEIAHKLPNHFLRKVDLATMAHSVEARVPFLDHKLIELVYSFPTHYKTLNRFFSLKLSKYRGKHILEETMKKYLPQETVNRRKQGFLLPFPEFFNEGEEMIREYVLKENGIVRQFLSRKELRYLFITNNNKVQEIKRQLMLWRCFILSVWSRAYNVK